MKWFSRSPYSLLDGGSVPQPKSTGRGRSVLIILVVLAFSLTSFFLGRSSTKIPITTSSIPIPSLDSTQYTFTYNRTFSESSPESDAAWGALFPEQAGYFTHPTIAPHRSTFSVFHLLHCLNGIRQGYWAVHDIAVAGGNPLKDDDLPMMISPPHIRHCIDLLRQSLMCNADLTVEVKDDEAGGVHGFGTEHQCTDWDSLFSWTTEWETRKPHL